MASRVWADALAVETGGSVWEPLPASFDKARNATQFSRFGTRHSQQIVKAVLDAAPEVDETFCLSVDHVILVFSASYDEHLVHIDKAMQMMQDCSMSVNPHDTRLGFPTSTGAGIQLTQVGNHKFYIVTDVHGPRP